ncbi:hypothetical protein VTL71DRAFT_5670 [Oculimacula yallundae]|uniref:Uncharacterized protein n=1 Tax=Oculimacula yallundae TaxID=86028 RepID=A0ABR4BY76_9HELO
MTSCINTKTYLLCAFVLFTAVLLERFTADLPFRGSKTRSLRPFEATIGIELTRGYSRIGTFWHHGFEVVLDEQGRSKIPHPIRFEKLGIPVDHLKVEGQTSVGQGNNIRDSSTLPEQDEPNPEAQAGISTRSSSAGEKESQTVIANHGGEISPLSIEEDILTHHFIHLKQVVEATLNQTVNATVISIPNYINKVQTDAVQRAALSAGLDVKHLFNESSAASTAYYNVRPPRRRPKAERNVSDYHLIYNIDEYGTSMVVESSLGGDHRLVATLEDRVFPVDDSTTPPTDSDWTNKRTVALLESILEIVQIDGINITDIVVAGTTPHIDDLRSTLESFFPGKRVLSNDHFGHEDTVIYGAALKAYWGTEAHAHECGMRIDSISLNLWVQLSEDQELIQLRSGHLDLPGGGSRTLTATTDDSGSLLMSFFQGDSVVANDNHLRGSVRFESLAVGRNAEVEIYTIFQVDNEGLTIIATERASNITKEENFKIAYFDE